jgi:hypothetical protein
MEDKTPHQPESDMDVPSLIRDLNGKDKVRRDHAERRLARSAELAVQVLSVARRKDQFLRRAYRSVIALMLVQTLLYAYWRMFILHKPFKGEWIHQLVMCIVGFFFCGLGHSKADLCATKVIADTDDIRVIGKLVESLNVGEVRRVVVTALYSDPICQDIF